MRDNMIPEDRLCLLLARGQIQPDVEQQILKLLGTPLCWPLLLERSYAHQVYPLVYRNLRQLGFPGVPDEVQASLKGTYSANALRNRLLAEELACLLHLLRDTGIPAIPLKGVTLAESLYGDPADRVCADIDLLIPPAHVNQALDLIRASGYRDEFPSTFFSKLALRYGRHYVLVRDNPRASFRLELHWQLVQHSCRNDEAITDIWAEARPKSFFGAPALSLSPEWQFLYLSIHAADHEWQSLKWLSDIHEVASSTPIDWAKAKQKAEWLGLGLAIRQGLTASSLLLGTPVPLGWDQASLPASVRLFPNAPSEAAFSHLRLLGRPVDKLRYVANVVLVPKPADRDFLQLPTSLGFLYYVARPPRLVGRWLLRLAARVFQDRPVDVGKEREVARKVQAEK
jgi:hypothetical protein